MANRTPPDPYRGYRFRVEIDGITQAGFQECSGLDATTDVVDYREGTDAPHVRKLSGMNKYSPITLKRGITDSDELWRWRQSVIDGRVELKNGSIVLMNEAGEDKLRWNFLNAWCSKWTGPSFNSTSTAVAVESIEIVHEELQKQ